MTTLNKVIKGKPIWNNWRHEKKILPTKKKSIRWIPCDYSAMKSLHSMWDIIIKESESDPDFSQPTGTKAAALEKKMTGKCFILLFNIMFDILSELSLLFFDIQRRSAILGNASSFIAKFELIFSEYYSLTWKQQMLNIWHYSYMNLVVK